MAFRGHAGCDEGGYFGETLLDFGWVVGGFVVVVVVVVMGRGRGRFLSLVLVWFVVSVAVSASKGEASFVE